MKSEKQSNAFERSVRGAPKGLLVLTAFFHFPIIARKQWWPLNPFQNPYWC